MEPAFRTKRRATGCSSGSQIAAVVTGTPAASANDRVSEYEWRNHGSLPATTDPAANDQPPRVDSKEAPGTRAYFCESPHARNGCERAGGGGQVAASAAAGVPAAIPPAAKAATAAIARGVAWASFFIGVLPGNRSS